MLKAWRYCSIFGKFVQADVLRLSIFLSSLIFSGSRILPVKRKEAFLVINPVRAGNSGGISRGIRWLANISIKIYPRKDDRQLCIPPIKKVSKPNIAKILKPFYAKNELGKY
jgi:hypothetical protein